MYMYVAPKSLLAYACFMNERNHVFPLRHMEDERIVTALAVLLNINVPTEGVH